MPRGYRRIVIATVGWLILSASKPVFAYPDKGHEQSRPREYPNGATPSAAPAKPANPDQTPSQPCVGAEQGDLSCDAIAAKAAYDQARDARRQILIGWLQAGGLVLSLFFSALATRAAFQAVGKANETLDETKKMNAAIVRPIIAIESASIAFDLGTNKPKVTLTTRNASNHTAHDWEWKPLLKYRANGIARKSRIFSWGTRGVAGIDLPPSDKRSQIPRVMPFALNQAEQAAMLEMEIGNGLHIYLTVFARCFDVFGNQVEDEVHFNTVAFNLFGALAQGAGEVEVVVQLQPSPPGVQVEGQEDEVPEAVV